MPSASGGRIPLFSVRVILGAGAKLALGSKANPRSPLNGLLGIHIFHITRGREREREREMGRCGNFSLHFHSSFSNGGFELHLGCRGVKETRNNAAECLFPRSGQTADMQSSETFDLGRHFPVFLLGCWAAPERRGISNRRYLRRPLVVKCQMSSCAFSRQQQHLRIPGEEGRKEKRGTPPPSIHVEDEFHGPAHFLPNKFPVWLTR